MFFVYGVTIDDRGNKHCQLLGAAVDEDTAKRRAIGWFMHMPLDCVYVKNSTSGLIHFFRCTAYRSPRSQSAVVLPLHPMR